MPEPAKAEKKPSLTQDLIAASIIVFLLLQKHAGFMLIFVMLLSLPFLLFNLFVMLKNPARRSFLRNKILLWIAAFICIIAGQVYLHLSTRKLADEVVSMVQRYTAKNGHCPVDIAVLGLSEDWLHKNLGFSDYHCNAGQPHFFYATTYIVFETEYYDFVKKTWSHTGG